MQSKKLSLSATSSRTVLARETDVFVPTGTHRFVIKQKKGARAHTFHLAEPGAEVIIVGIVDAQTDSTPSLETTVIHEAPHTRAETVVKTLSRDTAAPRYRGMIRITEGSTGCESYLNHHSLLIGEQAQSWTTPSLEILNDEVKCSHAATVRTLTPEDLFYLESRGISSVEAETVLINAFLADVQS